MKKTIFNKFVLISIISVLLLCFITFFTQGVNSAYAEADTTAPVINITDCTVRAAVGEYPTINATALDDIDGEIVPVKVWSDGAIDEIGLLTEGTHTCTITAEDATGNKATVTVTYVVAVDNDNYSNYSFVTFVYYGKQTVVKAVTTNQTIENIYPEDTDIVWYNGSAVWDFATDEVESDITLVASAVRYYEITVNTSGAGETKSEIKNYTYGTKIDFSSFNIEGYSFTVVDGDGVVVTDYTVEEDGVINVMYYIAAENSGCNGQISEISLAVLSFVALALTMIVCKIKKTQNN